MTPKRGHIVAVSELIKGMEQQIRAMCSMFAMLRARARVNITTGREEGENVLVSLQHQKQAGVVPGVFDRAIEILSGWW